MGIDIGIEFSLSSYAVLSVFFLQNIYQIIFSFTLSMACFLLVYTVWKHYDYSLEKTNYYFYLFNHLLPMFFIFYGLLLIKNENTRYQEQTRDRNWQLRRSNLKILRQKADITGKAALLEEQTQQLTELNSLKNKLFSVIAHDLKAPLYALRNLFRNVQLYDLPGDEIKRLVPEVINELTYTTGLMENLLQWAKSQMQAESARPQLLDIAGIAREVLQLLRLQAEAKKIYIDSKIEQSDFCLCRQGHGKPRVAQPAVQCDQVHAGGRLYLSRRAGAPVLYRNIGPGYRDGDQPGGIEAAEGAQLLFDAGNGRRGGYGSWTDVV